MRFPGPVGSALAALLGAAALGACALMFEPDRAARAPRLDGFGRQAMTVTTRQPAAQDLFTRGLLQSYAFNDQEAVRAFKAALAVDPSCAMCAWGVAHALGPNINALERGDLSEARRYIGLAQRHAPAATPRERALIDALAARYGADGSRAAKDEALSAAICSSGSGKAKADPLDTLYAARMRAIGRDHPDDPDITTLDAEAQMIATRADWWVRKTGTPAPGMAEMTERLERALVHTPDHTGLNHYLIHALDGSPLPQRAVVAADRLGALAPESPHLLHMPSHVYVRVGRYGDAVRANNDGLAAEVRQTKRLEAQGFAPSGNWDFHNVHFLWFAALMDGRGDGALEQARRLARQTADGQSASAEFMRGLPLLTLVRLERWREVFDEPAPTGDHGVGRALHHFARGVASARLDRRGDAQREAAALHAALDSPALQGKTLMGDDAARDVLGILAAELDAEVALAGSGIDAARTGLERAIEQEAGLEASEPPLLAAGTRLALGDLMLRSGRPVDAEAAFRADLVGQPGSGWALRGLARALTAQSRTAEAQRARDELARTWAEADKGLVAARL